MSHEGARLGLIALGWRKNYEGGLKRRSMSNRAYMVSGGIEQTRASFNFSGHWELVAYLAGKLDLDGAEMAHIEWGNEGWTIPTQLLQDACQALSLEPSVADCLVEDIAQAKILGEEAIFYRIR